MNKYQTSTQTNGGYKGATVRRKDVKQSQAPTPMAPTVENANALGLQKDLSKAQTADKINGFNNAYAKSVGTQVEPAFTPPANDGDYAAQILKLASAPATAVGQQQMRNLVAGRTSKILSGGDAMKQYLDDDVMRKANAYMNQYVTPESTAGAYYDKADALADETYASTMASLAGREEAQRKSIEEAYDRARKDAALAYAVDSRGLENILANQGLGRGLGAAPSSGYSETARLGALADYSGNVNQTYRDQEAAARELAAQFEAQRMQALMERNAAKQNSLFARADQENADRSFAFGAHQANAENDRYYDGMAYQRERDAIADQQALDALNWQKEQGLISEQQWQAEFDNLVKRQAIDDAWNQKLFDRDVYESDRAFDRGVYESDRDFSHTASRSSGGSGGGIVDDIAGVYDVDTLAALLGGTTPQAAAFPPMNVPGAGWMYTSGNKR